jgi:hypothetical protein
MTVELIELIAIQGVFRPCQRFTELTADHVPFDNLLGQQQFETLGLPQLALHSRSTAGRRRIRRRDAC